MKKIDGQGRAKKIDPIHQYYFSLIINITIINRHDQFLK